MSKRDVGFYIVDIFIAYYKITRYIEKFSNGADLLYDDLHWDATMRELQIVGEATKRLLNEGMMDENYRRIVNFRNEITHAYFGIDPHLVWEAASLKLPAFFEDIKKNVTQKQIKLDEAFEAAIEEAILLKKVDLINFLQDLQNEF